jgi:hypothetical protein
MKELEKRVRYRLNTLGGVIGEIGVTYRQYVRKQINATEAMTRKALLGEARAAIEGGEMERRIGELEEIAKRSNVEPFRPKVVK